MGLIDAGRRLEGGQQYQSIYQSSILLPVAKMARDNILLTYMFMDALFVISGGLLIIFSLVTKAEIAGTPTADNVARDLLFDMCPLNG